MKVSSNFLYGMTLLSPSVILLVLFTYYPTVMTFIDSLYSTPRGRFSARFVGLENYNTMFSDPVFIKALTNNFIYALITIPTSVILSLTMALLVNMNIRGKGLVRLSFFTPTILPMVAVANIWMFFYTPDYGLIDKIFSWFGFQGYNWLGSPDTALGALIAITIWKNSGLFMIFYLAALQQISPTLLEAARLEGASYWQRLWRVILPLLMPMTLFISINAMIEAIRLVDHVVSMTKGGPNNSTQLLLYYIYEVAFQYWDTAYAATLSVAVLIILALVTVTQFLLTDKKVHYR